MNIETWELARMNAWVAGYAASNGIKLNCERMAAFVEVGFKNRFPKPKDPQQLKEPTP